MNIPNTLQDCERLSRSPVELNRYIRARLVQLVGKDAAVAIRAIELLSQMGGVVESSDLSDVPTDVLIRAEQRALAWIKELNGDGGLSS